MQQHLIISFSLLRSNDYRECTSYMVEWWILTVSEL
jgi:hypothetical protein